MEELDKIINSTYYNNFANKVQFSHALFLFSPDNELNKQITLAFALSVLNENETESIQIKNKALFSATHPDCLIYPQNLNFLTADALEIVDKSSYKPMICKKKVFVINNFHTATSQAQNKLLKVLEEPPKNVVFIINTSQTDKVLPTILSRCQKYSLPNFNYDEACECLNCVKDEKSLLAFNSSEGYPYLMQNILQDENFISIFEQIKNLVINLKTSKEILVFSMQLSGNKDQFESKLRLLQEFYRDMLFYKQNSIELIKFKNVEQLYSVSEEYSIQALIKIIKLINKTKQKSDANANLQILADNLLLNILEVKYLCK